METNTIITKIKQKSEAEAEAIIADGNERAKLLSDKIIDEAMLRANEIESTANAKAEASIYGAVRQASLEVKLDNINRQHELLKVARQAALEEMLRFDKDKWTKLFTKLVLKYSMSGDIKICIPKSDEDRYKNNDGVLMLEQWATLITEATGTKTTFTLSDEYVEINGGLILSGDHYDMDLSFDTILDEIFELNEKGIAERLFELGSDL